MGDYLDSIDVPRKFDVARRRGAIQIDCIVHVVFVPNSSNHRHVFTVDLC